MSAIKIIAGDLEGDRTPQIKSARLLRNEIVYAVPGKLFGVKLLPLNSLDAVEIQTEESVKDLFDTASWAAAGALLAGPLGAVIGGVFGGHKKEVCFAAYLKDGRRFLAVADSDTFRQIQAAVF